MSQWGDRWSKILMPVVPAIAIAGLCCGDQVWFLPSHSVVLQYVIIVAITQCTISHSLRIYSSYFHITSEDSVHSTELGIFSRRSFLNISFVQVLYMQTSLKGYMQVEIRAALFHCWWNWSNSGVEAPPICSIFALFNPWKICSRNQEEC